MADVTITTDAFGQEDAFSDSNLTVFISETVGYTFYTADSDRKLVRYVKTTDGGESWGSAVTVMTLSTSANRLAVCWDQDTPGDEGTLIHCICMSGISFGADRYRALDTSDDSLGTEVTWRSTDFSPDASGQVSIAKMRGGVLCVVSRNRTGNFQMHTSTDDGGTWSGAVSMGQGAIGDTAVVMPGNEADANDGYVLFFDDSESEASLILWDNSGSAFGTETVIGPLQDSTVAGGKTHAYAVRHSDNHIILALETAEGGGGNDLVLYEITNISTNALLATLITDDGAILLQSVTIDEANDDVYVAYAKNPTGVNNTSLHYRKYDGSVGAEQAVSETTTYNAVNWISAPRTMLAGDGLFYVVWAEGNTLFGSAVNAVRSVVEVVARARQTQAMVIG